MMTSTKLAETLDKIMRIREKLKDRDTTNMLDDMEHFSAHTRVYEMFRDNLIPIKYTSDNNIFQNNICNQMLYLIRFSKSSYVEYLSLTEKNLLNDVDNFSENNKKLIRDNCDMILNDNINHNNIHDPSLFIIYFLKIIGFVLIEWKYSPNPDYAAISRLNEKLLNFGDSYLFVQPYRHCGDYYANFMNNYYNKDRINELKQILDILKPHYLDLIKNFLTSTCAQ